MSKRLKGLKVITAPVVLAIAAGIAGAGCSQATDGTDGGLPGATCKLTARIKAVKASSDALVMVSGEMKASAAAACAAIAGMPAPTDPTHDDVTNLCDAASAEITAQFMAAGDVSITIAPAKCTVNAMAQFDCEAQCQADANCMCEAPSIEARCDPGELSGTCSGTCEAGATCEGSADIAVQCTGTCEGTCEGTCDATCEGNTDTSGTMGACNGNCTGTCDGTCKGSCTITGSAGVMCSGSATCKGGCDVMLEAPKCEGELKPGSCDCQAAAECSGSCDGQASLEAECTPPSVEITGSLDATFVTTLKANLPALLEVVKKGELAVQAAADVAADVGALAGDLQGNLACAANGAADIIASVSGAAQASVSVNVSVMASAKASGSASTM